MWEYLSRFLIVFEVEKFLFRVGDVQRDARGSRERETLLLPFCLRSDDKSKARGSDCLKHGIVL